MSKPMPALIPICPTPPEEAYDPDECMYIPPSPEPAPQTPEPPESETDSSEPQVELQIYANEFGRFACPHCDSVQQSTTSLRNHIRVHTGERPFQCEVCLKCFKMPHHLRDHSLTHTGDRPFSCHYCDKSFIQRSNLRHHLQNVHSDHRHYPCTQCDEYFPTKKELKTHEVETSHFTKRIKSGPDYEPRKKPFVCELCPSRFGRADSMEIHLKWHQLQNRLVGGVLDGLDSDVEILDMDAMMEEEERMAAGMPKIVSTYSMQDIAEVKPKVEQVDEELEQEVEEEAQINPAVKVEVVMKEEKDVEPEDEMPTASATIDETIDDTTTDTIHDTTTDTTAETTTEPIDDTIADTSTETIDDTIADTTAEAMANSTLPTEPEADGADSERTNYNCRHCSRTFSRLSALKAHTNRLHQKAEEELSLPHRCEFRNCAKAFRSTSSLGKHMRTVHKGTRPETKETPKPNMSPSPKKPSPTTTTTTPPRRIQIQKRKIDEISSTRNLPDQVQRQPVQKRKLTLTSPPPPPPLLLGVYSSAKRVPAPRWPSPEKEEKEEEDGCRFCRNGSAIARLSAISGIDCPHCKNNKKRQQRLAIREVRRTPTPEPEPERRPRYTTPQGRKIPILLSRSRNFPKRTIGGNAGGGFARSTMPNLQVATRRGPRIYSGMPPLVQREIQDMILGV